MRHIDSAFYGQHYPCERPCKSWCEHRKCDRTCGELCSPCLRCEISPQADSVVLTKCSKVLHCKHPCMGLEGESCPRVCFTCKPKDVETRLNGSLKLLAGIDNRKEVEKGLKADPSQLNFVEFLCDHCFEITSVNHFVTSKIRDSVRPLCPVCAKPFSGSKVFLSSIEKAETKFAEVKFASLERREREISQQPIGLLQSTGEERRLQTLISRDSNGMFGEKLRLLRRLLLGQVHLDFTSVLPNLILTPSCDACT